MNAPRAAALLLLCAPAAAQRPGELGAGAAWEWFQERAREAEVAPAGEPELVRTASDDDNPWERASVPSRPPAQSLGFYSRGCLRGGVELPRSGPGYEKMRVARNRGFGHPRLIEFITRLAGKMAADPRLGVLLVGDMGYARGGPSRKSHQSHQNGLEADLWSLQGPAGAVLSGSDRENWDSPDVVDYDSDGFYTRLNGHWSPNKIELLRLAASDESVQRILVNPLVKKAVCAARGGESWVSKLRPEWGHADHFHVRLACQGSGCQSQAPVPGSGCGAELDEQWFGRGARERWRLYAEASRRSTPWRMPDLPAQCAAVLRER